MELFINKLAGINLELVGSFIALLVSAWKIYMDYKKRDKQITKWQFIDGHVVEAYLLAENIAKKTEHTKKDDAFVGVMRKFLEAFGYELEEHEEEAVKLKGSALHQQLKKDAKNPLE